MVRLLIALIISGKLDRHLNKKSTGTIVYHVIFLIITVVFEIDNSNVLVTIYKISRICHTFRFLNYYEIFDVFFCDILRLPVRFVTGLQVETQLGRVWPHNWQWQKNVTYYYPLRGRKRMKPTDTGGEIHMQMRSCG